MDGHIITPFVIATSDIELIGYKCSITAGKVQFPEFAKALSILKLKFHMIGR
jgi:hypothetical protein